MVIHYLSLFTIIHDLFLSFLVMMLEVETSQAGDFADIIRSTIGFAISPVSLSDEMII